MIVFDRDGGLTDDDLNAIGGSARGLDRARRSPVRRRSSTPSPPATGRPLGDVADYVQGVGPISKDGEAALVVLALNAADHGAIRNGVDRDPRIPRRARRSPASPPTSPARPGSPPTSTRSPTKRASTLLIATLGLVLVLLLLVYRAPLLALLPLIAVGAAYMVAIGIAYLVIKAGWIVVNTEGTFLLLVLVFGAGTDYSLLLVHRYREELQARPPGRGGAAAGPARERPGRSPPPAAP